MITDVVAALIWDGYRFLVCQRPASKKRGLMWEFVGGKVEPGETKQQALIRECSEELCVVISTGDIFTELIHEYPDVTIRLTLFHATITSGTPQKIEHNDIRWITTDEIPNYQFCPADKEILKKLMLEYSPVNLTLQERLLAMQDREYKAFQCSLIPTVPPDDVIGVRMPALRSFGKKLHRTQEGTTFMQTLPHTYYDENNLHGVLISEMTDFKEAVDALDQFLPFVNNWATCDLISPKAFRGHPEKLPLKAKQWLASDHVYTVRFGVGVLLKHYLDGSFAPEHLAWVSKIRSKEYYINMMIAWYFSTALAKQYDSALPYIERNCLDTWTHNKTIQKAIESYRITFEQKEYLRTLKRNSR